MDGLWRDLVHAWRALARHRAFTVAMAATLAVGLGGNGAVFSWLDALLLRPFPFPALERVVTVWEQHPEQGPASVRSAHSGDRHPMAAADVGDLAAARSLAFLAAFRHREFVLAEGDAPSRLQGALVSTDFFRVVATAPELGRAFLPEESEPGRDASVILSHALWRQRFGGRPDAIGRTLVLNERAHTVVGVMPRTFAYPLGGVSLWAPLALSPEQRADRATLALAVVARLAEGTSLAEAQAEADTLAASLARAYPATNAGRRVTLLRLREQQAGITAPVLALFQGAALFVLLIACVNVAGLLAARAVAREREMAVRLALGADRRRLVRQLLTEGAVVALLGAVLAAALARGAVNAIRVSLPDDIAKWVGGWNEMRLDARALAFTLALGLLTSLLFGLLPALRASRTDLVTSLKEGGRTGAGAGRQRARSALVAVQVTLSLLLLAGAASMLRGFTSLLAVYSGFEPQGVLTMRVRFPEWSHPDLDEARALQRRALESLQGLPGVEAAGVVSHLPADLGPVPSATVAVGGRPEPAPAERPRVDVQVVSPGYFEALRIPLRSGRGLTEDDRDSAQPVAVISASLAGRFWPDEDPLQGRLRVDGPSPSWVTVVGVAADVRQYWFDPNPRPTVYLPYGQAPRRLTTIVLRTAADPLRALPAVRERIGALDRRVAIDEVRTMVQVVAEAMAFLKTAAVLMGVLGAVALLLSVVGVYGMMADFVSHCRHEIGLRMALGAGTRDVVRFVAARVGGATGLGLAVGLPAAAALGSALSTRLFGVSRTEWSLLALVAAGVAGAALAAAAGPVRRAIRLDPAVVLRGE
jgi:putative ABC transport system permease protein